MLRTITTHLKRFKRGKRGVSNVIVVMLSLVILVIISANVILWSYKMNQLDWEKMNEDITITNVTRVTNSSWFVAQSEYTVNQGSHVSGSYTNTQSIDGQYEKFTEGSAEGWLAGWDKRVKITINSTDINEVLTDFPVLVYLSSSSGENNDNVTSVFDEVGSDYNATAYTTFDETTRLYFEVEYWNATSEKAWLWVKVPSVSNTADADIYIYYDSAKDGSTYNSPTNVWDGNFLGVWHMQTDASDSSSPQYNGTATGSPSDVTGKIGGAQNFNAGIPDRYDTGTIPHGIGTGNFMMEVWVNRDVDTGQPYQGILANDDYAPAMYVETGGSSVWGGYWGGDMAADHETTTGVWYYYVMKREGSTIYFYRNGVVEASSYTRSTSMSNATFRFGASSAVAVNHMDGAIDEARFSNTSRSAAWIKASYETERDDLLDFGSEESLGVERNELEIVGVFAIGLSTYPLTYIQTVEIQLKYNGSDTGENWYLKAYNWTAMAYSDSGFNNTSGHTPTTGWDTYAVNLTDKWRSYVNDSGVMYVKLQDNQADVNQTTIDIDFLAVRVVIDGAKFTFENKEALTSHLVSLWINNSTLHQRYDMNIFINSADTTSYIRSDITLPSTPYTVKVVTERGNAAVFTSH